MKLRRSGSARASVVTADRRPGKWRRRVFLLAILGAIFGGWTSFRASYLSADGLITGDVVQVGSLASGRVLEAYVTCNDAVERGAPLARIENDARALTYVTRLNQLREQSAEGEFSLDRLQLGVREAAARLEEQLAVVEERQANWEAHDRLFKQGIVTKVAWSQARASLRRAEAQVLTAETLLRNRQSEYDSAQTLALSRSDGVTQELALLDDSDDLRGEIVVRSPRGGIVLTCETKLGEVVLAGDPMFEVFDPSSARIRAFVDEADLSRIFEGMRMEAQLSGFPDKFEVSVTTIDPVFRELPEEFQRYFWQSPSWTTYATVVMQFEGGAENTDRLRLGAKVSLSRVSLPSYLKNTRAWLADAIGPISIFGYSLLDSGPGVQPAGEDT